MRPARGEDSARSSEGDKEGGRGGYGDGIDGGGGHKPV